MNQKTIKKLISIFLILITLSCGTFKSVQNSYYPIKGVDAQFKYADSDAHVSHKDLNRTELKNGKKYSVIEIKYSWGKNVETLYRIENGNVLYYDNNSQTENMIMPNNPKIGLKWTNTDQSWEYEIIEINAELETPEKQYSGLLIMKATQLSNRDETKLTEYLNYYQKGLGKIASVGNGELMTYRIN